MEKLTDKTIEATDLGWAEFLDWMAIMGEGDKQMEELSVGEEHQPQGYIRVVDREGHVVRTLMASIEPVMETLPLEILESIQEWVLERNPECSVVIK